MRKIVYDIAASLDGCIAGTGGQLDGFLMEGPHVEDYLARIEHYDTALIGRSTYELGYAFGMAPGANPYPHMKSIVFSQSISLPADTAVEVVSSGALDRIDALRRSDGPDIYLAGGSRFAGFLMQQGRVDKLIVKLNPILLGQGLRLFDCNSPFSLTLINHKSYSNGVMLLEYEVSGPADADTKLNDQR